MLSPTKLGFLALAAVSGAVLVPASAEAGRLFNFFNFWDPAPHTYYPDQSGKLVCKYPDGQESCYVAKSKPHRTNDQSGQQQDSYGPRFNEPVYVEPPKKKTPPAAGETASGMSCDKASKIVSDYGFSSVTPANCKGKVYAFNATRSGKNYVISLNPANGELTEVKKAR